MSQIRSIWLDSKPAAERMQQPANTSQTSKQSSQDRMANPSFPPQPAQHTSSFDGPTYASQRPRDIQASRLNGSNTNRMQDRAGSPARMSESSVKVSASQASWKTSWEQYHSEIIGTNLSSPNLRILQIHLTAGNLGLLSWSACGRKLCMEFQ